MGVTKGECLISTACIQHVYAAKSWPSLAGLSTCCLNSRNATAWRMLVTAGMSMSGSLHSIRGHPSWHTGSPLERNRSTQATPSYRPRKKNNECDFGSTPTCVKLLAFIGSLKDDTCTRKACQAQCMNRNRNHHPWRAKRNEICSPKNSSIVRVTHHERPTNDKKQRRDEIGKGQQFTNSVVAIRHERELC